MNENGLSSSVGRGDLALVGSRDGVDAVRCFGSVVWDAVFVSVVVVVAGGSRAGLGSAKSSNVDGSASPAVVGEAGNAVGENGFC